MAIYEVGRAADQSFIAAEYVEGETLSQRLSLGALAEAEALRVAGQIAEALWAAMKNVEIRMVKVNEILSRSSWSAQKFMHEIRVLMAKNYIDNLS
jgi:hypothetical protein